jgi:error-prone DNA polymerase
LFCRLIQTFGDSTCGHQALVLSAGMIVCHGRMQREGEVIHVITDRLEDLSDLLRNVGDRDEAFPIKDGRGDDAMHPSARDPRDGPGAGLGGRLMRDIFIPELRLGSSIKVPTRYFR